MLLHTLPEAYCLIYLESMKTKDALREEIWQLLQKKKVARFPGATGRIPNFVGAEACARVFCTLVPAIGVLIVSEIRSSASLIFFKAVSRGSSTGR